MVSVCGDSVLGVRRGSLGGTCWGVWVSDDHWVLVFEVALGLLLLSVRTDGAWAGSPLSPLRGVWSRGGGPGALWAGRQHRLSAVVRVRARPRVGCLPMFLRTGQAKHASPSSLPDAPPPTPPPDSPPYPPIAASVEEGSIYQDPTPDHEEGRLAFVGGYDGLARGADRGELSKSALRPSGRSQRPLSPTTRPHARRRRAKQSEKAGATPAARAFAETDLVAAGRLRVGLGQVLAERSSASSWACRARRTSRPSGFPARGSRR
jgi:hypothetical protein